MQTSEIYHCDRCGAVDRGEHNNLTQQFLFGRSVFTGVSIGAQNKRELCPECLEGFEKVCYEYMREPTPTEVAEKTQADQPIKKWMDRFKRKV